MTCSRALTAWILIVAAMCYRSARAEVIYVTLETGLATSDAPVIEIKTCVSPERAAQREIPAVYQFNEKGEGICVVAARQETYVVPAKYEVQSYRLLLEDVVCEEDLVQKFKDLAAGHERVKIIGEQTERGFRVFSITRLPPASTRNIDFTIGTPF